VRMERAEYDFNLKTVPLPAVDPALGAARRERIMASSRGRYAVRREEVEAINRARHSPGESEPEALGRKTRIRIEVPLPEGKTVPEPPRDVPSFAPQMPGRGGEQHKYLQQLIKRWAESRGYQVS